MRLVSPAALLRISTWFSGSIGLMAMPSVPRISRSSILRVWSVMLLGMITVTSTPNSSPAASAPASACSQKSATPLVMKA